MRCYQVWYHATVVDTLQDEGDCLVSFTYYLNEAVVGREEMAELESIGEIPRGEEVEGWNEQDVRVRWTRCSGKGVYAASTTVQNPGFTLKVGDKINLTENVKVPNRAATVERHLGVGTIKQVTKKNDKFELALQVRGMWHGSVGNTCTVAGIHDNTTAARMHRGLMNFELTWEATWATVHLDLMGKGKLRRDEPAKHVHVDHAPNVPELNRSQKDAVRQALDARGVLLIRGPPGTGKTHTMATIVYNMLSGAGRILVCAGSNAAVDNVGLLLIKMGMAKMSLRIFSKTKEEETVEEGLREIALHMQDGQEETDRIRDARVVLCTCMAAADPRLSKQTFPNVLIDEACQAMEPEVLLAVLHGAKRVILVGDDKQLPPTIVSQTAQEGGLGTSMFERLIFLGHIPVTLKVQYRMHPKLRRWPSENFYAGQLRDGVSAADRTLRQKGLRWSFAANPMVFVHVDGSEERTGSSFANRRETSTVVEIVKKLVGGGLKGEQVTVLTPYDGQVGILEEQMANVCSKVKVSSVDAYQGKENDVVVVSAVRTHGAGFVQDHRRLNVAVTRAKCGLVIVGDQNFLSGVAHWRLLIKHYKKRDCVVNAAEILGSAGAVDD